MVIKFIVQSIIVLLALYAGLGAAVAADVFFDYKAVPASSKKIVSYWDRVSNRWQYEQTLPGSNCVATKWNGCGLAGWYNMINASDASLRGPSLRAFNKMQNGRRYVEDIVNWNRIDYWESPGQFYNLSGDCEDFAISKYFGLREKGESARNLRIIVVWDRGLRLYHAVLLVRKEKNWLMLDNRIDGVIDAEKVVHYIPVYALNEEKYWVFTRQR